MNEFELVEWRELVEKYYGTLRNKVECHTLEWRELNYLWDMLPEVVCKASKFISIKEAMED